MQNKTIYHLEYLHILIDKYSSTTVILQDNTDERIYDGFIKNSTDDLKQNDFGRFFSYGCSEVFDLLFDN